MKNTIEEERKRQVLEIILNTLTDEELRQVEANVDRLIEEAKI